MCCLFPLLRQYFINLNSEITGSYEIEMAVEPDLSKRLFISWKTEKPFKNRCRVSSNFSLGETTWCLKMESCVTLYETEDFAKPHYTITLIETENRKPKMPFCVETSVKLNSESEGISCLESCSSEVHSNNQRIWRCVMDSVTSRVSQFHDYSELIVDCIFKDLAPSMFHIENETIEVATQTDFYHVFPLETQQDDKLSSDECEQGASCVSSNLNSLSQDLSKLLGNKVLPDITLRCGNHTVAAHKAVLAARSKIFSTMFQFKMSESETGVLEITDIDVQVLELFLKYLYTGRLFESSHEDLIRLYAAGEKYAVTALMMACSEHLINNLNQENCLSFLLMADAHNNQEFKNAIFNFIFNHVEIIASDKWETFCKENFALSHEVLQIIVKQKCLK